MLAVHWLVVGAVAVVVASVVALVLIVVAPWKEVRREPGLDPEVETRLLLGEDPDQHDDEPTDPGGPGPRPSTPSPAPPSPR